MGDTVTIQIMAAISGKARISLDRMPACTTDFSEEPDRAMRKRFIPLLIIAAGLGAATWGAAYLLGLSAAPKQAFTYETVSVTKGAIRKIVSTSGPVRALVTVSVGSQLSGLVETVSVDFNSTVKPGDILAILDKKTFAARVAQAEADLAVAVATLTNQEAALIKAEAIKKLAGRSVERQEALANKGFSAQATLDAATRDSEVAAAEINVAKALIESAKANIKQRQASLDQALIDLERTDIRAPIEGTVISRTVDPGQTVAASLQAPELFKIAQDLSRIRIEAQVNEADVGAVAEGNVATFTVDAYPDQQFEGRVTQVRLASTEINSVVTYTVIIEAANAERKLFPGMTANVVIVSATRDGVLRISNDAIRFKPKTDPKTAGADRQARIMDRLKSELQLSGEQEKVAQETLAALAAEQKSKGGSSFSSSTPQDAGDMRQRLATRLEQSLAPMLNPDQRTAFDKWKQGRDGQRGATVWVLGPDGEPERRVVRTGIADDKFTEILGGSPLAEGDQVIIRARETKS